MNEKSEAIGLFQQVQIPANLFAAEENAVSVLPHTVHLDWRRISVCIMFSKVLITLFPLREF